MAIIEEPLPGFFDTLLGGLGTVVGVSTGILRVSKADRAANIDIISADYVINSILAIAWSKSSNKLTNGTDIFNCVNSNVRTITTGKFGLVRVE